MIMLRRLRDGDIALFKKWLDTPHVAKWYHNPLDWIEEIEKQDSDFCWIHHFIVEYDGKPIGFCQYYKYEDSGEAWHGNVGTRDTYSIDYMIGELEFIGKGFGRHLVRALISKVWMEEKAKCVIVQPEPENKASCKTLLSCGFKFDNENKVYIKFCNQHI